LSSGWVLPTLSSVINYLIKVQALSQLKLNLCQTLSDADKRRDLYHVCPSMFVYILEPSFSFLCVNYQFKCKLWTDEDGCDTGEQKDGQRVLSYFPIVHCSLLPQGTYQEPFSRSLHKLFEKSWSVILWLKQSLN